MTGTEFSSENVGPGPLESLKIWGEGANYIQPFKGEGCCYILVKMKSSGGQGFVSTGIPRFTLIMLGQKKKTAEAKTA